VSGPTPGDTSGTRALRTLCPALVDVYRSCHPGSRRLTCFGPYGGARLDRAYAPAALCPRISRCWVGAAWVSDHRPLLMDLTPAAPSSVGKGLPRVKMLFWANPAMRQVFVDWLAEHSASAPPSAGALLAWWPQFKASLAAYIRELNRQHARPPGPAASAATQARLAAAAALTAAEEAVITGSDASALSSLPQLRATWAAAARHEASLHNDCHLTRPPKWHHVNERPCPAVSALVRPSPQLQGIPALRRGDGTLLGPGVQQAEVMASYQAHISRQQPTDDAAQAAVLDTINASLPPSEESVTALGLAQVTPQEVLEAIQHSPSGKAPGCDGIPVEVYRRGKAVFVPLLAKVFSAIGEAGVLPRGFLDGAITSIYKAGPACDPGNYRPITLLNTDYRLLSKVLTYRLLPVLDAVISVEQSAFLTNRSIGNNVWLLQLLPHRLAEERSNAVVAFLDTKKAFDTVDRSFLFAVLNKLGLGEGFLNWARLLLGDTRACAVMNGFVSRKIPFKAGVRQGCPMSPLLFLCVAESLLRFIKSSHTGVSVAGMHLVASQFADDIQVFLPDFGCVPSLLCTLSTFKAASGQAVSLPKSRLLQIGAGISPPAAGATVCDIPVVPSASALGFDFPCGVGAVTPKGGWEGRLERVQRAYTRLASLHMSVFGRAIGASSYGVSTLLYHAEFVGLPPALAASLTSMTAKLVDRDLAPADQRRAFPGVKSELLSGPPSEGGFGMLPWVAHVQARHAVWGTRLLDEGGQHAWQVIGRAILRDWWSFHGWDVPGWHLAVHLTGACQRPGGSDVYPDYPPSPITLQLRGLVSLGRVVDVSTQPLPLSDWCASAPLFGNPFLHRPPKPDGSPAPAMEQEFLPLLHCGVATVSALCDLESRLAQCATREQYEQQVYRPDGPVQLQRWPPYADRQLAKDEVAACLAALPGTWVAAARAKLQRSSEVDLAPDPLMIRLGWEPPSGRAVKLHLLSVRDATSLCTLTTPVIEERKLRHTTFVALALAVQPGTVDASALSLLSCALKRCWRLRWDNHYKETFWRLALDGLPTAQRLHLLGGPGCPCGGEGCAVPDRLHHFWHCAVAVAVRGELSTSLGSTVTRRQLWLMDAPPLINQDVWCVVALAALNAIWRARTVLCVPRTMASLPRNLRENPSALLAHAAGLAVERFWAFMHDFASAHSAPGAWRRVLQANHPFLTFLSPAGRLHVNRPAVAGPSTPAADGGTTVAG